MHLNQSSIGRKTLYNLMRLQSAELNKKDAILEDYRLWSLEQLFQPLNSMGWNLDKATFIAYSESVQTVQELLELLTLDEDLSDSAEDQVFLIIFELWRRLAAHEANLEVLCDELDYQIEAYEKAEQVDRKIDLIIDQCHSLIQTHSRDEKEACLVFKAICLNCAQDFEAFLYDFITDQLQAGAFDYADELYKKFNIYIQNPLWFDFIKVQLSTRQEAEVILDQIYRQLEKSDQVELGFEILFYLSEHDIKDFFYRFFDLMIKQNLEKEDLLELDQLVQSYLEKNEDQKELQLQVLSLFEKYLIKKP